MCFATRYSDIKTLWTFSVSYQQKAKAKDIGMIDEHVDPPDPASDTLEGDVTQPSKDASHGKHALTARAIIGGRGGTSPQSRAAQSFGSRAFGLTT